MTKKANSKWFLLNRRLHRDLGYLAVALTIVFAVSGIALNHRDHWNPNYIVERLEQPIRFSDALPEPEIQAKLLQQFDIDEQVKASYWESPAQYKLFFEKGGTLSVNFNKANAVFEKVSSRPIFKEFNTLHLNEVGQGWIIFSDIYAGVLLFLALSGLFMVKGNNSPWRRRKAWLVILGTAIPALYIAFILNAG